MVGGNIGSAANDLQRLITDIHLAYGHVVGIRVRLTGDRSADHGIRDRSSGRYLLDLKAGKRQPFCKIGSHLLEAARLALAAGRRDKIEIKINVFLKPAKRDFHLSPR